MLFILHGAFCFLISPFDPIAPPLLEKFGCLKIGAAKHTKTGKEALYGDLSGYDVVLVRDVEYRVSATGLGIVEGH